ncbi:MAG: hypothetical protein ACJAW7_003305, partial [Candidatus Azotimanducaceae bacterium]
GLRKAYMQKYTRNAAEPTDRIIRGVSAAWVTAAAVAAAAVAAFSEVIVVATDQRQTF